MTPRLQAVLDKYSRWQLMSDPGALLIPLGAYAANKIPGEPLWLMIVATPSNGKTERLLPLKGLPDVHETATLTEGSLLSGVSKREWTEGATGGLLMKIGKSGIILCKDFTSVLSMRRDKRDEVLGALREIYDGSWVRHVGSGGGQTLPWAGKVGLIAACTPVIDSHHVVMGALGERFLIYRLDPEDPEEVNRKALDHRGQESELRGKMEEMVRSFFDGLSLPTEPMPLSESEVEWISALSRYVALARAPVIRDGRTRNISQIPGAEGPPRLAKCFAQLLRGLEAIGTEPALARRLVERVALDCLPANRRAVLSLIVQAPERALKVNEIEHRPGLCPTTARRALEDLEAYQILSRTTRPGSPGELWSESELTRALRPRAFTTIPEMLPPTQDRQAEPVPEVLPPAQTSGSVPEMSLSECTHEEELDNAPGEGG